LSVSELEIIFLGGLFRSKQENLGQTCCFGEIFEPETPRILAEVVRFDYVACVVFCIYFVFAEEVSCVQAEAQLLIVSLRVSRN
jgi:hypothetical protein